MCISSWLSPFAFAACTSPPNTLKIKWTKISRIDSKSSTFHHHVKSKLVCSSYYVPSHAGNIASKWNTCIYILRDYGSCNEGLAIGLNTPPDFVVAWLSLSLFLALPLALIHLSFLWHMMQSCGRTVPTDFRFDLDLNTFDGGSDRTALASSSAMRVSGSAIWNYNNMVRLKYWASNTACSYIVDP